MPLEMGAITTAFSLSRTGGKGSPWAGRVGGSEVKAIHIGMGPSLTRSAMARLFDGSFPGDAPVDHVMIAGICGGLDPSLEVGTLVNPEVVIDHASGAAYRHTPPGDRAVAGKLITTEQVTLDPALSRRFWEEGCVAVDMESSAVAEVCQANGCPWSVYRCIGDRHFDGLIDERLLSLTNPDGSGNVAELERLIASEPNVATKLDRLTRDATMAARLAAEAAVRGCLALD
jgi:adenosylhomocysteine nucleosidase